jgi:hypothetical protein
MFIACLDRSDAERRIGPISNREILREPVRVCSAGKPGVSCVGTGGAAGRFEYSDGSVDDGVSADKCSVARGGLKVSWYESGQESS